MTAAMLGVMVLIGLAALYLAVRIGHAVRVWHEPTTRWARRSPVDRRQRQVPVAVERRRGPRRQDDIARQFLGDLARPRHRAARTGVPGGLTRRAL